MSGKNRAFALAAATAALVGLSAPVAGAATLQGPSGFNNDSILNLSENQLPIAACNLDIPVNVLLVQIPISGLGIVGDGMLNPTTANPSLTQNCTQNAVRDEHLDDEHQLEQRVGADHQHPPHRGPPRPPPLGLGDLHQRPGGQRPLGLQRRQRPERQRQPGSRGDLQRRRADHRDRPPGAGQHPRRRARLGFAELHHRQPVDHSGLHPDSEPEQQHHLQHEQHTTANSRNTAHRRGCPVPDGGTGHPFALCPAGPGHPFPCPGWPAIPGSPRPRQPRARSRRTRPTSSASVPCRTGTRRT